MMRLAVKATALVAVALLVSLATAFTAASALILADHRDQEDGRARQQARLVSDTVALDLSRMEGTARELAGVATALAGAEHLDENATSSLIRAVFASNDLDLITMSWPDRNGTLQTFSLVLEGDDVTWGDEPYLPEGFDRLGASPSGLAWMDGGPVLFAAASIGGYGALLVGQRMDETYEASILERTGLAVAVLHPDAASTFRLEREGIDVLRAYAPVTAGEADSVAIRIDSDRDIYADALLTVGWFAAFAALVVVGVLGVTLWLLRRWVTDPLGQLRAKFGARDPETMDVEASDEVEALDHAFDHLMARLNDEHERLERSNRDLASFASVVSHDLKSPLSTVRVTVASLRHHPALQRDQVSQAQLERLDRGVESMRERIDGILAYSRAADGEQSLRPTPLDEVVDRVLADLQGPLAEAQVRVLRKPLPAVMADPEPIAQLIQNLVANAIKYRRPDAPGRIWIWATRRGDAAVLHVRDNGRGFHPEEARHMMEPFVRLAGAEGTQGHGIGLATCRRIAERHGTTLQAVGRPGEGAEFWVGLATSPEATVPTPRTSTPA